MHQILCTSQRCPSLQHAANVLKHLQTTKEKQNHTRHLSNQFALILSVLSLLFLIFSSFLVFIHLLQEIDLRTAWDGVPEQEGALAHGSFNEGSKLRQVGVSIKLKAKVKQAGYVELPVLCQHTDDPLGRCKSLFVGEALDNSLVLSLGLAIVAKQLRY